MKISQETYDIVNKPKTTESRLRESGKSLSHLISESDRSVSEIDAINGGKAVISHGHGVKTFLLGQHIDRKNDTISWDNETFQSFFSSDASIIRCPVFAELNDTSESEGHMLPHVIINKVIGIDGE